MRKTDFTPNSKEFVLDVTKSFAYEAHCQPKKIMNNDRMAPKSVTMSKKLRGALQKLLMALNRP